MRIAALLIGVAMLSGCRYSYLQSVINTHVGFAHLTRGCGQNTVDALRQRVTGDDVPVLVRMLDSRDHVTQICAALALETIQPEGLGALQSEFAKMQAGPVRNWDRYYAVKDALAEAASGR